MNQGWMLPVSRVNSARAKRKDLSISILQVFWKFEDNDHSLHSFSLFNKIS